MAKAKIAKKLELSWEDNPWMQRSLAHMEHVPRIELFKRRNHAASRAEYYLGCNFGGLVGFISLTTGRAQLEAAKRQAPQTLVELLQKAAGDFRDVANGFTSEAERYTKLAEGLKCRFTK